MALGATRTPATPSPEAISLARAAAAAVNGSLVGVDLLPTGDGGWVVLEVNGAVEFNGEYLPTGDVFAAAVDALTAGADRTCELVPAHG